jgi:citrate synthase
MHDIQILFFCNPGLLTIGPRFGGAIDDAARYFKDAHDRGLSPYEFVETMKKKGIRVPGIGHRYKTISTSGHLNFHSSLAIK